VVHVAVDTTCQLELALTRKRCGGRQIVHLITTDRAVPCRLLWGRSHVVANRCTYTFRGAVRLRRLGERRIRCVLPVPISESRHPTIVYLDRGASLSQARIRSTANAMRGPKLTRCLSPAYTPQQPSTNRSRISGGDWTHGPRFGRRNGSTSDPCPIPCWNQSCSDCTTRNVHDVACRPTCDDSSTPVLEPQPPIVRSRLVVCRSAQNKNGHSGDPCRYGR
jgi:hypothetical protein